MKSIIIIHHEQEQSRCAISELYEQAHEIQELYHKAVQVSEKIEKKNVIQYAVLEFIDSITVLYGQGLACSSCTFQSTRATGNSKKIPKTLKSPPTTIPQVQSQLQTFLLKNFQSEILTSLQSICSGQCFVLQENKTRMLL